MDAWLGQERGVDGIPEREPEPAALRTARGSGAVHRLDGAELATIKLSAEEVRALIYAERYEIERERQAAAAAAATAPAVSDVVPPAPTSAPEPPAVDALDAAPVIVAEVLAPTVPALIPPVPRGGSPLRDALAGFAIGGSLLAIAVLIVVFVL